jgi:methylenetetrahydrofolate dehydrogenase (NADP+)/methenyltetrahydrofolate cyclohydrolase
MAVILDGKALAAEMRADITARVAALRAEGRRAPGLAVVLLGNDPASQVYVGSKVKQTEAAGMRSIEHRLPDTTTEAELLGLVAQLNADPGVDGILVQLPLPKGIDSSRVIEAIDPSKDVDGFHPMNAGRLATGLPALVPCTPRGCVMLAKRACADLTGLHAVIVGRSNIVGKPLAQLLLAENCTVTIAHSRTRDLPAVCRLADVLVAAIGRPRALSAGHVKPGAIVIDVGINRVPTADGGSRLVGDVDYEAVAPIAGAITPVPGGVGPMTIACLLDNTVTAYRRRSS